MRILFKAKDGTEYEAADLLQSCGEASASFGLALMHAAVDATVDATANRDRIKMILDMSDGDDDDDVAQLRDALASADAFLDQAVTVLVIKDDGAKVPFGTFRHGLQGFARRASHAAFAGLADCVDKSFGFTPAAGLADFLGTLSGDYTEARSGGKTASDLVIRDRSGEEDEAPAPAPIPAAPPGVRRAAVGPKVSIG